MALVLLFASVIVIFMLPHGSFWLSALILSFVPGYLIERWLDLPLHPLARPATWIGLSFAVLCAELLAARMGAEPLPVEANLAKALHALRG